MSDNAADLVRSYVQRVQNIEEEIKERNSDKRDVYAEAKSKGLDVPALKAVISYLRKDQDEAENQRALFDLYLAQVNGTENGTENATRVRARTKPERPPSEPIRIAETKAVQAIRSAAESDAIPEFLRRTQ